MATVFKRADRRNYQIAYFNAKGERIERSSRTTDFKTAERIARELESRELLKREGVIDSRLDRFATEARRVLQEHIYDFLTAVGGRVSKQQASQLMSRISRVLDTSGMTTLADLTLSTVETRLGELRRNGYTVTTVEGKTRHEPLSARTVSYYGKAMKQFSRWLARDGRIAADPLMSLKTHSTEADNVYVRSELSDEELERIIEAAEDGPAILGMSGVDRAMAYRIACGSGFRANELRSLKPESFDLDSNPPTIKVLAGFSKRRRNDMQPIHTGLAKLLRPWLESKEPGSTVLDLPARSAKMLREDMEAARATWIDESKTTQEQDARKKSDFLTQTDASGAVRDFHSMRHLFVSRLVNSGASVRTCQELARHSTPMLTVGRYAHVRLHDLTGALQKLPVPGAKRDSDRERLRATGSLNSCASMGENARQRMRQQSGRNSQAIGAKQCENSIERRHMTRAAQGPNSARLNEQTRRVATRCETEGVGARTQDLRLKRPLLYH